MSVQTSRTARYGGAVATFTTAASPGAALTALFNAIDTMLTTAGWTRIQNTGSPGPNTYTSSGESGTESLFLQLTTGAYGTASGTDISGGSFLCIAMCQWADASGNYCNRIGAPRTATGGTQPAESINCVSLAPSTTYEYMAICDKDGASVVCTPSGNANQPRYLLTGLCIRPAGARATLVTSGTVANGNAVSIGVTSNPITAGYQVGDVLQLVGIQAASSGNLGDIVAFKIQDLSSNSITAVKVSGLTQTLSAGALVGESPQPLYGTRRNLGGGSAITQGSFVCMSPLFVNGQTPDLFNGVSVNLWSQQVSSQGTGGAIGASDGAALAVGAGAINPSQAATGQPTPSGLGTSGSEPRTNAAALLRTSQITSQNGNNSWYQLYMKYLYPDQRLSSGFATGVLSRLLQTNDEYVSQQFASTTSMWMGPFPKTSPTVLARLLPVADEYPGELQRVPSHDGTGDSGRTLIIDRPYPQDFVAPNLPTNSFNQGIT